MLFTHSVLPTTARSQLHLHLLLNVGGDTTFAFLCDNSRFRSHPHSRQILRWPCRPGVSAFLGPPIQQEDGILFPGNVRRAVSTVGWEGTGFSELCLGKRGPHLTLCPDARSWITFGAGFRSGDRGGLSSNLFLNRLTSSLAESGLQGVAPLGSPCRSSGKLLSICTCSDPKHRIRRDV